MKVAELIEGLQRLNPEAEVRLAVQPAYLLQHTVEGIYPVSPHAGIAPDPQDFATAEAFEEALEIYQQALTAPDHAVVYLAATVLQTERR